MLLLDRVMTLGLLLVARRRHARAEVAGPCNVVLGQSQHVLHLDVLQVVFNDCLGLLLLVTGSQALVEQLLRVLARASRLVLSQAEHGARADSLSRAELLCHRTASSILLHLLHALEVLLLLLQIELLRLLARRLAAMVLVMLFLGVTPVVCVVRAVLRSGALDASRLARRR